LSQRIVFFGSQCGFADTVLQAILDAGHEVLMRVIPGIPRTGTPYQLIDHHPGNRLGMTPTSPAGRSITDLTPRVSTMSIPLLRVNDHHSIETAQALAALNADISVVACYPRRIPSRLIGTTNYGGLNVHPSLLPAFRGPEPLFWIYHACEQRTGVTVHRLTGELDAGPIVRQTPIDLPIGYPGDKLWNDSAAIGGGLVTDILKDPGQSLSEATPQPQLGASYQSLPSTSDLRIDPDEWNAQCMFHFLRGVIPLGYLPAVRLEEELRRISTAHSFGNSDTPDEGVYSRGTVIRCRTGWINVGLSGW
jgi:methionyl-tRNA formyltransferase